MLEFSKIDLSNLCTALEDHSHEGGWWLDPRTGEVDHFSSDLSEEETDADPEERGLLPVEPVPSSESYRDLEDFVAQVRNGRARELLERAIAGRGAFRRFKDTLLEFPDLRQAWFKFHDARMERRAIEWLVVEGLVDEGEAERALSVRHDPELPELSGPFDAFEIARAVAADLRALYRERLRRVILFGSWARGDAHPESDVDLLVVLDRVESAWDELDRMDEILWRHSFRNHTVVAAIPVSEDQLERPTAPALIRAKIEGRAVA